VFFIFCGGGGVVRVFILLSGKRNKRTCPVCRSPCVPVVKIFQEGHISVLPARKLEGVISAVGTKRTALDGGSSGCQEVSTIVFHVVLPKNCNACSKTCS
jgi:hypothetical protein